MSGFQLFLLPLLMTCGSSLQAQLISLSNASFEGTPQDAVVPQSWMACKEGTTPDILPGFWGVYQEASDGQTYLGLITRDNNTWESIGQRLSSPLQKNGCYTFKLDLAHADTYSGYNGEIKLRIWISEDKCKKDQLIFESLIIRHTDWKTYEVRFNASLPAKYIMLEAFHTEDPFSFKGNILIDYIRPVMLCDRT